MILMTSIAIVLLARLAILITLVHFLWTFSEIHATIVAYCWLALMVGELGMKMSLRKGDKSE